MHLQPHHIGLIVSDLGRSTGFYQALGFETVSDSSGGETAPSIRFMRSDALQLELFCYPETLPAPDRTGGKQLGFRHLAFLVDDVDETLRELKTAGVVPATVEARDVPLGFRVAFFEDPDGVEMELTQPL
jgi:glyoxylase I family protein